MKRFGDGRFFGLNFEAVQIYGAEFFYWRPRQSAAFPIRECRSV